jgi:micrococcal nuclease
MFLYYYSAKLDRVVDGDTIDAMVDLGFDIWKHVRIRFNGIDAYESRTKDLEEKAKGLKAKARVEELLALTNGEFKLYSKGVDKYGRCLGEIKIEAGIHNTINLNEQLINEGLAVPYDGGKRD